MSQRRKGLMLCLIGVGVLLSLGGLYWRQNAAQVSARHKLDNLLGDTEEVAPPSSGPDTFQQTPATPEAAPLSPPSLGGDGFFGLPLPKSGVAVQETPEKYVLRIPLADFQDAANVKLEVSPHHIEVSGQTGSQENGASLSTSFMQSFSTSQEVEPDQVRKKTEKRGNGVELIITIPKKSASGAGVKPSPGEEEFSPPTPKPARPLSPEDEENTRPTPYNNPFQGIENRVI